MDSPSSLTGNDEWKSLSRVQKMGELLSDHNSRSGAYKQEHPRATGVERDIRCARKKRRTAQHQQYIREPEAGETSHHILGAFSRPAYDMHACFWGIDIDESFVYVTESDGVLAFRDFRLA